MADSNAYRPPHSARLVRVEDERGVRVVVKSADDELWIANELMAIAVAPERVRVDGDFDVDGDVITFGTSGEGLGRLSYQVVDRTEFWHVARREGLDG